MITDDMVKSAFFADVSFRYLKEEDLALHIPSVAFAGFSKGASWAAKVAEEYISSTQWDTVVSNKVIKWKDQKIQSLESALADERAKNAELKKKLEVAVEASRKIEDSWHPHDCQDGELRAIANEALATIEGKDNE